MFSRPVVIAGDLLSGECWSPSDIANDWYREVARRDPEGMAIRIDLEEERSIFRVDGAGAAAIARFQRLRCDGEPSEESPSQGSRAYTYGIVVKVEGQQQI